MLSIHGWLAPKPRAAWCQVPMDVDCKSRSGCRVPVDSMLQIKWLHNNYWVPDVVWEIQVCDSDNILLVAWCNTASDVCVIFRIRSMCLGGVSSLVGWWLVSFLIGWFVIVCVISVRVLSLWWILCVCDFHVMNLVCLWFLCDESCVCDFVCLWFLCDESCVLLPMTLIHAK